MQENSTRFSELPQHPEAVLVDVGFTLVVYDPGRVAELLSPFGVSVRPELIEATQATVRAELSHSSWAFGPSGEGRVKGEEFFLRVLTLADAQGNDLRQAAVHLWQCHLANNLWTQLIPGSARALELMKQQGIRLAVISNAEGTIDALLQQIGVRWAFDVVLDSTAVGIAKPDPRIFQMAVDKLGVQKRAAIMVGDSVTADVHGAWSAGIAAALIDPLNLHPDCSAPRFPDLLSFAEALNSAK